MMYSGSGVDGSVEVGHAAFLYSSIKPGRTVLDAARTSDIPAGW